MRLMLRGAMRRSRAVILLSFAALLVGIASFAVVYQFLETGPRQPVPFRQVAALVGSLEQCRLANGNSNKSCIDTAKAVVADLARTRSEYFRAANFNVHLDRDILIFHKPRCLASDLVVPTFVWAVYPLDVKSLPVDRVQAGYLTGTHDFRTSGFQFDGQCLLAIRLPIEVYIKFEAGQYDKGKWLWFVS
jgi:hypothetical protein